MVIKIIFLFKLNANGEGSWTTSSNFEGHSQNFLCDLVVFKAYRSVRRTLCPVHHAPGMRRASVIFTLWLGSQCVAPPRVCAAHCKITQICLENKGEGFSGGF